ncbi:V-type ATP synthase subunit D [Candidatus Woesearchaeota archaeon CG_4_10_14_0_8_um_filter_47_5]|nr:MAG: V-type ATP synthase subunit D [Candidatus Woesearchaeota archaeon CG_4_10_14_0_8_um_filter_47_5]
MNVKPTRSELMKLKKKIKLAQGGYRLLKKKRDGLILEFFEILKRAKSVRAELTEKFIEAQGKVNKARVLEGDLAVNAVALSIAEGPIINVETKNVMGVVVPSIESSDIQKPILSRGYGAYSASAAITESARAYEELVEYIILAAEVETTMKKLLYEIERTKRRVNALEFDVIPNLQKFVKFIEFRLEEAERETIFRTKMLKKA